MVKSAFKISICIPTFRRVTFLKRLLDSIAIQSFKNYEVIITDDSRDTQVYDLIGQYKDKFTIRYSKNSVPLGTPANWNEAIKHARGEWIKLMHDDDWFSSSESLKTFVESIEPGNNFVFSAYTRIYENNTKPPERIFLSPSKNKVVEKEPNLLFANNFIGPPSVTLVHRSIDVKYDESLKWRVDIDFYIRLLKQEKKLAYINRSLINVGMSGSQITQSSINDPGVELPEAWVLLEKYGASPLKNMQIYDAWWRLFRNMNIKTEKDLRGYVNEDWPPAILRMLGDLRKTPHGFLSWGVTSKLCMGLSYLKNRSSIK